MAKSKKAIEIRKLPPDPVPKEIPIDCILRELSGKKREFGRKETLFLQGDRAVNVMYILQGEVKISVLSKSGREAVLAISGPGEFIGEAGLAGQPLRMATASARTPVTVLAIENREMVQAFHVQSEFADGFLSYMLHRKIRMENDLIDQLFNSSEKRLARALLQLARNGKGDKIERVLAKIPQQTLAEMVGVTRSRVNFFMTKFKKMGLIKCNNLLHVNTSLLDTFLSN